jgi:hypothetical protein
MVDYFYKTHEEGWTMHRAGAQARWPQSCTPPEGLQVVAPQLLAALEHDVMFQLATQGYLPCGPSHGSPEADANLVRMLEVSARIPNTWIQLIPTFTLKHVDKGSSQANVEYFNGVYDHVLMIVSKGNYKHVIWEMFNEVVHPISSHIKDEDVRDMIRHVQATSTLPIGTDYHGGRAGDEWQGRYPNIWRRHVDYIAFHTERNPEPPLSVMRAAQRRYGYVKPVLIDETVSWASDQAIGDYQLRNNGNIAERGYGTEESRMLQCVVHLKNIYQVRQGERRWRPFFHSIWGIHGYHIGQMPNFDRDIIGGQ